MPGYCGSLRGSEFLKTIAKPALLRSSMTFLLSSAATKIAVTIYSGNCGQNRSFRRKIFAKYLTSGVFGVSFVRLPLTAFLAPVYI